MLVRVSVKCMAWPDGNVDHGYVDLYVKGFTDELKAAWFAVARIQNLCPFANRPSDIPTYELLNEDVGYEEVDGLMVHDDDPSAEVVNGQGEALDWYPVGTKF